eukprot:gene9371-9534_t
MHVAVGFRLRTNFYGDQTQAFTSCRPRQRLRPAVQAGAVHPGPVEPAHHHASPHLITSFGFRPHFHEEFELGPMLGSGSFGVVHVALHLKSGRKYAVKSIPKRFFGQYLEQHFVARIQHEVDVARHMGQSLNVIHLVEAFEDDVCVDLVMELAAGGSLLIADILRGVAQCHAKGVVLRDIKPDNFLFLNQRDDAPLKMVDFGLAAYCQPDQLLTERAGTPCYVAPEVLRQSYCFPADIWSVGITAYQLLTGRFPWHADPEWVAEVSGSSLGGPGNKISTELGVATSNKLLWRAILYADFDFDWPPWDTLSVLIMVLTDILSHHHGGDGGGVALRQVAKVMAADPACLQGLAEAFSALDTENSGRIPYSQVVALLKSGKWDLSEVEVRMLVSQFDIDHDGNVDYYEWVAALMDWGKAQGSSEWESWLKQVFDQFDLDGSGKISSKELKAVLGCGHASELEGDDGVLIEDAVPSVLRQADTNGDGQLSFEEFAALLQTDAADRLELFASRRRRDEQTVARVKARFQKVGDAQVVQQ